MSFLTGKALLAGITGWPVMHSKSPRLHGYWLDKHGVDGAYVPLPIAPGHYHEAIKGLVYAGFRGCNVTAPHKLTAFEVCDSVCEMSHKAGAVNTLVFEEGRVHGFNTDGFGWLQNLRSYGCDPNAGPALVLGAGGAARAVIAVLQHIGVPVTVANRTRETAEALTRTLPGLEVIDWDRRNAAIADHALLVNTTSLGMAGNPPLEISLDGASPGMTVADIVYAPLETALLADARARGLRTSEGLGMLLHQAVIGHNKWFGTHPVVDDALRAFVLAG